jgi:hypothetical protein
MRLVCTQLLSNEWSHESVVLLGSSLFVLKWKTLPFQLWVTPMPTDVKHLLFLSNSEVPGHIRLLYFNVIIPTTTIRPCPPPSLFGQVYVQKEMMTFCSTRVILLTAK